MTALRAKNIWRDLVDALIPALGLHKVIKSEAREWGTWIESAIPLTRAALKEIDSTLYPRTFFDGSSWTFKAGNYTAAVAADTVEAMVIKATAIAASAGAWVRDTEGSMSADWFAIPRTGLASAVTALQRMFDVLALIGFKGEINGNGGIWLFSGTVFVRMSDVQVVNYEARYSGASTLAFKVDSPVVTKTRVGAGAIAVGTVSIQLTDVSGIAPRDDIFIRSTDDIDIVAHYKKGEAQTVVYLIGDVVYFEGLTQQTYTNGIVIEHVKPWRRVFFKGHHQGSAQQERGIEFFRSADCGCEITTFNVGHFGYYANGTLRGDFFGAGSNPAINYDNGLNYVGVHGDGDRLGTFRGKGSQTRHVVAGGGSSATSFSPHVIVQAVNQADSAADGHSNIINPRYEIQCGGIRNIGTQNGQSNALTIQGGGVIVADVLTEDCDINCVIVQLLQNTDDEFHVTSRLNRAKIGATFDTGCVRGIEVQIQKPGGKVRPSTLNGSARLATPTARAVSFDTSGSHAALVVESLTIDGAWQGVDYGVLVLVAAGHTLNLVRDRSEALGIQNGHRGHYYGGGTIKHVVYTGAAQGVAGNTSAIGAQVAAGVVEARAIGTTHDQIPAGTDFSGGAIWAAPVAHVRTNP